MSLWPFIAMLHVFYCRAPAMLEFVMLCAAKSVSGYEGTKPIRCSRANFGTEIDRVAGHPLQSCSCYLEGIITSPVHHQCRTFWPTQCPLLCTQFGRQLWYLVFVNMLVEISALKMIRCNQTGAAVLTTLGECRRPCARS